MNEANLPAKQRTHAADLPDVSGLLSELKTLIHQARERTAYTVNAEQTLLYWHIGSQIRQDIFKEERADYGERIVPSLSAQLAVEYERGFSAQPVQYDPIRRGFSQPSNYPYPVGTIESEPFQGIVAL